MTAPPNDPHHGAAGVDVNFSFRWPPPLRVSRAFSLDFRIMFVFSVATWFPGGATISYPWPIENAPSQIRTCAVNASGSQPLPVTPHSLDGSWRSDRSADAETPKDAAAQTR